MWGLSDAGGIREAVWDAGKNMTFVSAGQMVREYCPAGRAAPGVWEAVPGTQAKHPSRMEMGS